MGAVVVLGLDWRCREAWLLHVGHDKNKNTGVDGLARGRRGLAWSYLKH